MELKIRCSCGTKYKFDVEPVNGHVPAPLACPNCQASWTEHANAMIAQTLGLPAPAAAVAPAIEAAPVAPGSAPSASPAPAKFGLRLSGHPAPAAAAVEAAPTPATTSPPRHTPYIPNIAPVVDEYNSRDFGRGVLGAALGALLGGLAFYILMVHAEVRIKLVAIGIGVLAGFGAKLMGKDRSKELGVIAAVLSIGMIVGAEYLAVMKWYNNGEMFDDAMTEAQKSDYDERVEEAKKVLVAIPNGTDQEIRLYLAKEWADEGEKPDPKAITADDIREFKNDDLPMYRKLADGSYTREEYDKENTIMLTAEQKQEIKKEGERVLKWVFLAFLMGKFNLVCIAGSAGAAYKIIANA